MKELLLLLSLLIGCNTQGDGRHSSSSSYGLLTTMKGLMEDSSDGSLANLLNYGMLSLAHVGPGFVSFGGMRFCAWFVMGSSQQRKFQFSRRTEVIRCSLMR